MLRLFASGRHFGVVLLWVGAHRRRSVSSSGVTSISRRSTHFSATSVTRFPIVRFISSGTSWRFARAASVFISDCSRVLVYPLWRSIDEIEPHPAILAVSFADSDLHRLVA